jgi:hypothetical protein
MVDEPLNGMFAVRRRESAESYGEEPDVEVCDSEPGLKCGWEITVCVRERDSFLPVRGTGM